VLGNNKNNLVLLFIFSALVLAPLPSLASTRPTLKRDINNVIFSAAQALADVVRGITTLAAY